MSEVDIDSCIFGQGLVVAHLFTLVVGDGSAHLALEAIQDGGEGFIAKFGNRLIR